MHISNQKRKEFVLSAHPNPLLQTSNLTSQTHLQNGPLLLPKAFSLCCNREKTGSLKTNAGRVCIQSDRLKVAARWTHEELDSVILAPYGTKVAAALWVSRLVFGTITMILHSLHSEQHLVTPGETGMRRNQQEQEKG